MGKSAMLPRSLRVFTAKGSPRLICVKRASRTCDEELSSEGGRRVNVTSSHITAGACVSEGVLRLESQPPIQGNPRPYTEQQNVNYYWRGGSFDNCLRVVGSFDKGQGVAAAAATAGIW